MILPLFHGFHGFHAFWAAPFFAHHFPPHPLSLGSEAVFELARSFLLLLCSFAVVSLANPQTKLRTLDIGNNEITAIENVSHLKDLEEFWASYNKIESLANLHEELGGLPNLETVYLEGNPCQRNDMAGYRRKVMLALPQVQQIDAT